MHRFLTALALTPLFALLVFASHAAPVYSITEVGLQDADHTINVSRNNNYWERYSGEHGIGTSRAIDSSGLNFSSSNNTLWRVDASSAMPTPNIIGLYANSFWNALNFCTTAYEDQG